MIWTLLFGAFTGILNWLTSWLPIVSTLPLVDTYLSTGMGYVYFVGYYIPPVLIMVHGFLVLLSFKLTMFTLRVFKILH